VRLLAVTSDARIKVLPDVATIAEAGIPGYEFAAWIAVLTPAGVPRPIIDVLHATLKKALDDPDVEKRLSDLGLDPMFMTPEQFAQRLKSDYGKYAKVIVLSGAKVE